MGATMKRHLATKHDRPVCGVKSEGALIVEQRKHVTCERCKRIYARSVLGGGSARGRKTKH